MGGLRGGDSPTYPHQAFPVERYPLSLLSSPLPSSLFSHHLFCAHHPNIITTENVESATRALEKVCRGRGFERPSSGHSLLCGDGGDSGRGGDVEATHPRLPLHTVSLWQVGAPPTPPPHPSVVCCLLSHIVPHIYPLTS